MNGCHKNEWLPQKYSLWKLYCFCVWVCQLLSCVRLCESMDFAHQSSLFMEFSRQEYWSGLPFPSLGDLPNPGMEPGSPALQVDSLLCETPGKCFNMLKPCLTCLFSAVRMDVYFLPSSPVCVCVCRMAYAYGECV